MSIDPVGLGQDILKAAVFSPDKSYRYFLDRELISVSPATICTFIMLNPSTDDDKHDDHTVAGYQSFASAWGYTRKQVVNLSPVVTTDPNKVECEPTEVWERNMRWILEAAEVSDVLVAPWGAHRAAKDRARATLRHLREAGQVLQCLGTTQDGAPTHPARIKATTPLRVFSG